MMGIVGYLHERESGSFRSSRFRRCKQNVKDWLERLSASPALNQPCEFSGEPKATFLVDFSPDRSKIASAHGDHTVRVTNVTTGKCTHILTGHPRTPWCLAFHPSHDDILASGCLGGQVRIWDLRGGGSEVFHSDSNSLIASLTFHPVDRVLVFSTKNMLYFWDWTQHEPFKCCTTSFEYERVRWVQFDTLGHYLYTGICNNTTVTRAPMHDVMHRDDRLSNSGGHPNWQQRQANRQRYERLVSRFFEDQQQRIRDIVGIERPTSPVHEDRLRQAYDYARYVTSHSRDNYNWIQLARRRSRADPATGAEESTRPPASYSMFIQPSQQLPPGANSPPPLPHRDYDNNVDGPGEDAQMRDLDSQQEAVQPGRGSPTVGSERSLVSRPARLSRLLRMEARHRTTLGGSHTRTRPRRRSGDGSSSVTSAASISDEQGWAPMSASPLRSGDDEAGNPDLGARNPGVPDDQNPAQARWARSTSTYHPLFPQRMRLLFQDSDSYPAVATQSSTETSSTPPQQSSRMSGLFGLGDRSDAVDSHAARSQVSGGGDARESGGSGLQQRTLHSTWSGRMSGPNSAFSAPSTRSRNAPSSAQRGALPSGLAGSDSSAANNLPEASLSQFPVEREPQPRPQTQSSSVANQCVACAPPSICQLSLSSDVNAAQGDVRVASSLALSVSSSVSSSSTASSVEQGSSRRISPIPSTAAPSSSSKRSYSTAFGSPQSHASSVRVSDAALTLSWCLSQAPTSGPQLGSGTAERDQPLCSVSEHDQLQSVTSECEQPQSGTSECDQPQSGMSECDLPRSGTSECDQPQSDTSEHEPPCSGTTEHDQHQSGTAEHDQHRSGSAEHDQPRSGTTEHDLHRSGTAEHDQPHSGTAEHDQPQSASDSNLSSTSPPLQGRSWRSQLRQWEDSHPTSSRDRAQSSGDVGEMGEYVPGSQSCSYLHRQLRRGGHPLSVRTLILTDISRLRRLAHSSMSWSCDFRLDADSALALRCPICLRHPERPRVLVHRREEQDVGVLPEANPFGYLGRYRWGTRSSSFRLRSHPCEGTSDGTSQTQGELNEPEHADRGTDMAGLAQHELGGVEEEGGYVGADGSAPGEGVALEGSTTTGQPLQRVDSDLERQLSENDDEISRIESNYRESMRRLAEDRERILSTLRERSDIADTSVPLTSLHQPCASHSARTTTRSATPASSSSSRSVSGPPRTNSSSGPSTPNACHPTAAGLTDAPADSQAPPGSGHFAPRVPQSTDDLRPLHTLPTASGSNQDSIEVLTGSGESETITYHELARRLANRDDVMVVGNHRRTPATSRALPSAAGGQGGSHLLRSCLVSSSVGSSHPAPVPPPATSTRAVTASQAPPLSSSHPVTASQAQSSAGATAPPLILVQRPQSDEREDGSNQEHRSRGSGDAEWISLEQRHLHPHYSRSILDETINRPNDAMQSAINRAIAGVFMSSGEQAVASNIVPGTHRIQRWDFRRCQIPDLTKNTSNIVVEHCKIHNDASIDVSRDSTLLATFVNNHGGFPDDNILAVFSLRRESFGQCLYTKSFGPNAISVSMSPSNQYVMVGLASKRMMWAQVTDQLVGQIFRLNKAGAGEYSMMHVTDLYHPVRRQTPWVRGLSPVSVNSARWLPDVGEGIVYGTNHGDLHFYRAGRTKAGVEEEEAKPRKFTISTQTGTGSIRRSAFTQTADEEHDN